MTPWGAMMQAAAWMGVGPQAFWRLSLREWRMLTEAAAGTAPMARGDMERMAERWPDERDD